MREITKYVINYETKFDNEDDCRYYEIKESMKTIQGVKFFSEDGKEITDYSSLEDLLDSTFFIRIIDKDDFNKFEEMLCDEIGYGYWADGWQGLENEIGLFYYDENFDRWMHWDKQYNELLEIRKKINY